MPQTTTTADALAPTILVTAGPGNTPDTPHPAVQRMQDRWCRCRDLYAGSDVIQAKGTQYLPKHPAETTDDYERRRVRAKVYNAFKRTIRAMVGLVFQRDPILAPDVPEAIRQQWENLDLAGKHGAIVARNGFLDAMVAGHGGWFVDYPPIPDADTLTKADEQRIGARPYWVWYRAEDIISWRYEKRGAAIVLTQLVLREWVETMLGQFGSECRPRYRVYRRPESGAITYAVWEPRQRPSTADDQRRGVNPGDAVEYFQLLDDGEIRNQAAIPFAPLYVGEEVAPLESVPALLDLADTNLDHYVVLNDRRHLMHLGCVPVPVRKGYRAPITDSATNAKTTQAAQAIGPNVLMDVPADGGFEWAEITGASFGPSKDELERLTREMAALGLAFIAGDTRAPETAKAKTLEATAQNASLADGVRALRDALELGLGFHAAYLKLDTKLPKRSEDGSGGSISVNTEFTETTLAPEELRALSDMEARGQLTLETLWFKMEQGKVLPSGFDKEKELAKLTAGAAADRLTPRTAPADSPYKDDPGATRDA